LDNEETLAMDVLHPKILQICAPMDSRTEKSALKFLSYFKFNFVPRGHILQEEDEPAKQAFIVISGSVGTYKRLLRFNSIHDQGRQA
jgi:CRP-like cAMP-binding protein